MEKQELQACKKKIRKEKVALRQGVPGELVQKRSEAICAAIGRSKAYREARTILMYRAMPGEVSLDTLAKTAENDGKRIAYPRCVSKTRMEALVPGSPEAYTIGAFGIREPDPARSLQLDPAGIDLVLAPCAAFDEKCGRLGMGAGYYDRYLERCGNAKVIAVAFELQKTEKVPADAFDRPMDAVVTEAKCYEREKK